MISKVLRENTAKVLALIFISGICEKKKDICLFQHTLAKTKRFFGIP
jgi:hypothetical protein